MKNEHGDLLKTEYDTVPGESFGSVCELILEDVEFDLSSGGGMFLTDRVEDRARIEVETKDMLKRVHRRNRSEIQKKVFQDYSGRGCGVNGALEDQQNSMGDRNEMNKKRRKLMKGLKRFTGIPTAQERRFKGWSDDGHKALEDMIRDCLAGYVSHFSQLAGK